MASASLRRAINCPDKIKLSETLIVSSPVTVGAGSSAVTKSAEHAAGPNCPAQPCYHPELGVPIHRLPSDRFPAQAKKDVTTINGPLRTVLKEGGKYNYWLIYFYLRFVSYRMVCRLIPDWRMSGT